MRAAHEGADLNLDANPDPWLEGLPPVVGPDTRLVVLGSFPGAASLAAGQYYAHPRNRFWPLMGVLCGIDTTLPYPDRVRALNARGVGVWDVYAQCEREGSLDSAIRAAQLNDFPALLQRCTRLNTIVHNGGESFRHAKVVEKSLAQAGLAGQVTVHRLPSTSPANASWTFEQKLTAWRAVLNP